VNLYDEIGTYGLATRDWPSYGDRGFVISDAVFDSLSGFGHYEEGVIDGRKYLKLDGYFIQRETLTDGRNRLDAIWRDKDKAVVLDPPNK
jgi:hypothetical protein